MRDCGRRTVVLGVGGVACLLFACGPKVASVCGRDDAQCGEGTEAGTGETDPQGGSGESTTGPPPIRSDQVDVLFVVDNSGSMGEEQGLLATAGHALIEPLEAAGVRWRFGFTTTDNGNPLCASTTPEKGRLRATSCRSRSHEFVFNGAVAPDTTDACLDPCKHDTIEVARPWLEWSDGEPNWAGPATSAEAFACVAPQGINGCGFEAPLETLRRAIVRSETEGEEQFGFLRPETLTVVVIVSDEIDCSYNPDHETIFLSDAMGGNEVFWSDPSAESPGSAVCWNAGVACMGAGPTYDCHAANFDVDGNPVADARAATDAVIRPLSRYVEFLDGRALLFAGIVGVDASGEAVYADTLYDVQFQSDFGIGPGCQSSVTTAIPPVRMRELAEALGGTLHSVCAEDYAPILADLADGILARLSEQ